MNKVCLASLALMVLPRVTSAMPAPLFSKGTETFLVRDAKGRTPQFRLLNGTPSEKALAMAIASALNADPQTNPKIPVKDHIDVKVEKIVLTPIKGDASHVDVSLVVSGHKVDFPKSVSREKLVSGEWIEAEFPNEEKDLSIFKVRSQGHLRFRYDSHLGRLAIDDGSGQVTYQSAWVGEGEEKIRFSGEGRRVQ